MASKGLQINYQEGLSEGVVIAETGDTGPFSWVRQRAAAAKRYPNQTSWHLIMEGPPIWVLIATDEHPRPGSYFIQVSDE